MDGTDTVVTIAAASAAASDESDSLDTLLGYRAREVVDGRS